MLSKPGILVVFGTALNSYSVCDLVMTRTGKFISVEGGEGVGKSTQIAALAEAIRRHGIEVIVTREPGGTKGAEEIRQLLLNGGANKWTPRAEALLFAAARSDHVDRLILPALFAGKWVVSDRYLDSSRAYQSGGSELEDADILELHRIGSGSLLPDRTLVLDLPEGQGSARAASRDRDASDRIGGRDSTFHQIVHASFRRYAKTEPARVRMIDGSGEPGTVTKRLLAEIDDLLG
jgi:dTMP kinase